MNDAEIAGYMDWRGPGAYTERQLVRIRRIVEEVRMREREACAKVCETEWSNVAERMYGEECAAAIRARGRDAP
jgi:hypothetical protein